MRILLFVFYLGFGIDVSPTHDVAIAMFRISQSAEGLALDVTLDIQDLSTDLGVAQSDIILADIQAYLDKHTQFEFNGEQNEISLLDVKKVRDHFLVKGQFKKKVNALNEIQIRNTCLVEIPDHSNIIQVQANGTLRDFRMHKERTSIQIKY